MKWSRPSWAFPIQLTKLTSVNTSQMAPRVHQSRAPTMNERRPTQLKVFAAAAAPRAIPYSASRRGRFQV